MRAPCHALSHGPPGERPLERHNNFDLLRLVAALSVIFANLLRNAQAAAAGGSVIVRLGEERDAAGRNLTVLLVGDSARQVNVDDRVGLGLDRCIVLQLGAGLEQLAIELGGAGRLQRQQPQARPKRQGDGCGGQMNCGSCTALSTRVASKSSTLRASPSIRSGMRP